MRNSNAIQLLYITVFYVLATLKTIAPESGAFYPRKPLGRFIKVYDTLTYSSNNVAKQHDNLVQKKQSIDDGDSKPIDLKFTAFNQDFHLELNIDLSVFHENALIEVNGIKTPIQKHIALKGRLKGYPHSHVFGSIINGVFRGSIAPEGHESSNGAFHVEHSGYYFENEQPFHSIIYHENHIRWDPPNSNKTMNLKRLKREIHSGTFCGINRPDVENEMKKTIPLEDRPKLAPKASPYKSWHDSIRVKREGDMGYTTRVCNLFLQSDTFLWDRISSLSHVKNNHELAQQEITSIFTQHVQGAQAIYQNTVLEDFKGDLKYHGVSFRVDRIRINTTADCKESHRNPFCSANIDVTNFLNLNSYINHDDFCLAYVFTYRDFSGGTLGLAWVAEPGGSGGICEKFRLMREANQDVKKCLNTGIVTLLNYGSPVALKVSQLTFAHEMGHNFGSKHDDDHKGERDCLPDENNPRGNYIMFASATSGDKENNNKFSRCSKDSIARLVDNILKRDPNCFKTSNGPFCGNKIQEEGEECDCGFENEDCQDKCCYPKKDKNACKLRENVILSGNKETKVLCSPSAGECCSNDCQFRNSTQICRAAGECYNSSHCNSTSAKCPPSEKFPDGTLCQSGTRICKSGECIGSICERIPGWQECSLKRNDEITDEMMCYVSCKENKTGAPCISTYQLEKDASLRKSYPNLANELLRNGQGIQLKPGAPCDNYRGYCDSFSRCRSVDADGPLARLRNLIFSTQMVEKIRNWITGHWWAVIPIILGLIIFMIAFVKICAVHTPSHNPNIAHEPSIPPPGPSRKAKKHSQNSSQNRRPPGPPDSRIEGAVSGPSSSNFGYHNNPANRRSQHFYSPQQQAMPSRKQTRPLSMSGQEMVPISTAPQIAPTSSVSSSSYHGVPPGPPRLPPNLPPPNYPPPDYNDIETRQPPIQHGKGRGKKGHLHALNQQASKYKH